jgi:hypothetical protein
MQSKLLPIYLNDHLAGATAGADLARRLAGSNESEEDYGLPLSQVAREIEEDREALRAIMSRLEVLHYDGDYDILAEYTSLIFESVWLAPPGSL